MTFTYQQSTGQFRIDGELLATGYSGHGEGRNNPAMEAVRETGPIPSGLYRISPARNTATHGPVVMPLSPLGHEAHGRSGFLIHGDNEHHDASLGCIILPRGTRELVAANLGELEVIA